MRVTERYRTLLRFRRELSGERDLQELQKRALREYERVREPPRASCHCDESYKSYESYKSHQDLPLQKLRAESYHVRDLQNPLGSYCGPRATIVTETY